MARALLKLVGLTLATLLATGGLWYYVKNDARDKVIADQRQQIETLENVATRLQLERRVADLFVTRQGKNDSGQLTTDLLFVEIGPDGEPLPPRRFQLLGDSGYVEAKLLKFERGFVREGDPLRGRSIALFTKLFGSQTPPDQGQPVDLPGQVPRVYKDARQSEFEQRLWSDFWNLADDTVYAKTKGVRVAQVEAVSTRFRPDKLYTVTLEADGGLSLTNKPLEPIFREAFAALRDESAPATRPAR